MRQAIQPSRLADLDLDDFYIEVSQTWPLRMRQQPQGKWHKIVKKSAVTSSKIAEHARERRQ